MTSEDTDRGVHGRLTDRQREVLEAAYVHGYFEWPREHTAEEVATALGISAPTFHEHLRVAQRELLGAYLERARRREGRGDADGDSSSEF